jgi:Uma2 family endonuclease
MAALPATKRLSVEEFLAWEDQQRERHEFVDGEIFAMTGGTLNHSLLGFTLAKLLDRQLRPRGCITLPEGIKVRADADIFYPDIVVACSRQQPDPREISNPVLLAEILSPSTESYDRDGKWTSYQQIPSLQTYVLVAQDKHQVDVYRRAHGGWLFSRHTDLEAVIELADPPCRLTLAELYADLITPIAPPASP